MKLHNVLINYSSLTFYHFLKSIGTYGRDFMSSLLLVCSERHSWGVKVAGARRIEFKKKTCLPITFQLPVRLKYFSNTMWFALARNAKRSISSCAATSVSARLALWALPRLRSGRAPTQNKSYLSSFVHVNLWIQHHRDWILHLSSDWIVSFRDCVQRFRVYELLGDCV